MTRIAMWCAPRTISTALMRAWENRPDTTVIDEPFYAHYLQFTGIDHPASDEIIAGYENDWRVVARTLTIDPLPRGATIWYQKHMAHHMLDHIELNWLDKLTNCFLIRSPVEVITSYIRVRSQPTLLDLGFPQLLRLFDTVRRNTGSIPPVIDSQDVLEDPRGTLMLLCEAVAVPFSEKMLSWPPGRRDSDGLWAPYWYAAVEKSTGFAPYRPKSEQPPPQLQDLLAQAQSAYQELYRFRLTTRDRGRGSMQG
ncbi:MAG: HAD family hydrolase [Caldilineaceae bacterium SB0675_bin_29]|uniref:HAD family hydrolase n=1 Tax=Caldilineaceae bacterium SB0675_bin_29 TaxID=2605266 RepID=A0A6B1G6K5_9CHLR|nr:HAD family hydrolase [Caldilineaceae bacterium SB0675_bin_29]